MGVEGGEIGRREGGEEETVRWGGEKEKRAGDGVAGQETGEDDQKGQRSGDGEMMQERRERDQLE